MIGLCDQWEFVQNWEPGFALGEGSGEIVRLPHTACEMPLHYGDSHAYQMICGYRRKLELGKELAGKRLFLQFDGAAHIAKVYLNGQMLASHRCGYTAFRVEITKFVNLGEENLVAVELDTTENSQIPPFGFVIDYLTYGGLYREVWLDIREDSFLSDVFVYTPTLSSLKVSAAVENADGCTLEAVVTKGGRTLGKAVFGADEEAVISCPGVKSWSPEHPIRYTCHVILRRGERILDQREIAFGFRTAEFRSDGFYLNGVKTFLRGLNRHQCYPYMGYAAPESLQREDARILKEELCCNAVRTSHYPQSHHFIDECDRLGLMVFTEIPGWQHIGDEGWIDQAVENVRDMVRQYRNHPSIVLWGVRINESQDNDEFYSRANQAARSLDPSRATSGVRYIKKSSLLEDVYAFNDFSHTGNNPGVLPKNQVTPDTRKALLVSEHNGHMFPTKSFDTWSRRQEQALRHMRVLNDAMADSEHAGCFGWCMFDYPTHKDFGSGDRVCYHGVMDAFRNPKLAAYAYASQGDSYPVLAVGTTMDIGDYPGGIIGETYVFTNADSVSLYKNDDFVTRLSPGGFKALPHGPMRMEDTIGCLLETKEGYDQKKADLVRQCLIAIQKKGVDGLSPVDIGKIGLAMVKYGLKYSDAMELYGKYVGNWGGSATVWRLEAEKDGKVVSAAVCGPSNQLHLEVASSAQVLREKTTYDMAAVRIRVLDKNNNMASYAQLPVELSLEGPAELVGPRVICAEGGMTGTYVKTIGKSGQVTLTICSAQTDPVKVSFSVEG